MKTIEGRCYKCSDAFRRFYRACDSFRARATYIDYLNGEVTPVLNNAGRSAGN